MNDNLKLGKAIGTTAFARAIAALGGVTFLVMISRLHGASAAGSFALFQAIVLIGSTFSCLGSNNAIMKHAALKNGGDLQSIQYLKFALRNSFFVCIVLSVFLYFLHNSRGLSILSGLTGFDLFLLVASTCGLSINLLLSGVLRGIGKPASACSIENGVSSLWATGLLLIGSIYGIDLGFSGILMAYCLAVWLSALQGVMHVRTWLGDKRTEGGAAERLDKNQLRHFNRTSGSFLVHAMASLFYSSFSIVIASHYITEQEIGYLKAAQQLCELIGFSLIVVNSIFPARFSYLFHSGNIEQLKRMASLSCALSALASAPFFLAFVLFPGAILSIYGDSFSQAAFALQILAVAQFANALTGPSGFMLAMTGHERELRNIAVFYATLGSALIAALGASGGLSEVAAGLSLVMILQNVTAFVIVRQKLGFHMFGLGR
jgi:O-antigen/teichoic acid export membrane protein